MIHKYASHDLDQSVIRELKTAFAIEGCRPPPEEILHAYLTKKQHDLIEGYDVPATLTATSDLVSALAKQAKKSTNEQARPLAASKGQLGIMIHHGLDETRRMMELGEVTPKHMLVAMGQYSEALYQTGMIRERTPAKAVIAFAEWSYALGFARIYFQVCRKFPPKMRWGRIREAIRDSGIVNLHLATYPKATSTEQRWDTIFTSGRYSSVRARLSAYKQEKCELHDLKHNNCNCALQQRLGSMS